MLDINKIHIGDIIIRRWENGEIWVMKVCPHGVAGSPFKLGSAFMCKIVRGLTEENLPTALDFSEDYWDLHRLEAESLKTITITRFEDKIYISWNSITTHLKSRN